MVKLKPTPSKRQSTKQRAKISKRVAEHHRKVRRDAKRNPQWKSRHEKDPGIPNSFPFKEQMLEELRQKRIATDEAKLAAKEQLRQERALRKEAGVAEEEEESDEDDQEGEFLDAAQSLLVQSPVYRGSLDQLMDDSTFQSILVALDARDPLSWALPKLQSTAQSKSKNFAYVLTRTDLVPREVVNAWTAVLEKQLSAPVFPVSLREAEEPLGLGPLLAQVRAWAPSQDAPTGAVVCGLEHAGRTAVASSLNRLAQQPSEGEDAASQPVQVYDSAHLISAQDPGKEDQASALRQLIRNKGPMQKSKETDALARALISRVAKVIDLQFLYTLPAFAAGAETRSGADLTAAEFDEFMVHMGRTTGLLNKRGIPAVHNVLRKLVFDWSHGGMMYYATPPLSRGEASQQAEAAGAEGLPTAKAGLDEVVLPLAQWREKYSRKQLRLIPGPVDPRTHEWDYLFFVPPTERSAPKQGKKAVQFADDGSEPEAELTEGEEEEDQESNDEDEDVPDEEGSDEESDEVDSDEDMEEEPQKQDEPEPASKATKKAAKAKEQTLSSNKRKAEFQDAGEQLSKKPSVKPGEKYDFFAHF